MLRLLGLREFGIDSSDFTDNLCISDSLGFILCIISAVELLVDRLLFPSYLKEEADPYLLNYFLNKLRPGFKL